MGAQAPRIERQKGAGEGGFRGYSTSQRAVVMKHSSSLKRTLLNVIQSTLIWLFTPLFFLPHLVKLSSVGKKQKLLEPPHSWVYLRSVQTFICKWEKQWDEKMNLSRHPQWQQLWFHVRTHKKKERFPLIAALSCLHKRLLRSQYEVGHTTNIYPESY